MARLVTGTATLIIKPIEKETPKSNWIDTVLGLEYHLQDQNLYIELPQNEICLRVEEFDKLIQKSKEYIESLPSQTAKVMGNLKSFCFFPLEPSFNLELSSGSFDDESHSDGGMWIDFRIQLNSLNVKEIELDSIGCSVWTKISDYLRFLDNLEQEVQQVMAV